MVAARLRRSGEARGGGSVAPPSSSSSSVTSFPAWPCALLLLFYVSSGAVAFCAVRPGWSFVDSFFFCFAALATIGISSDPPRSGRVAPLRAATATAAAVQSRSHFASGEDGEPVDVGGGGESGDAVFVMLCTLYLLFGLALLSMCLNLVSPAVAAAGRLWSPPCCACLLRPTGGRSRGHHEGLLAGNSFDEEEEPPS